MVYKYTVQGSAKFPHPRSIKWCRGWLYGPHNIHQIICVIRAKTLWCDQSLVKALKSSSCT